MYNLRKGELPSLGVRPVLSSSVLVDRQCDAVSVVSMPSFPIGLRLVTLKTGFKEFQSHTD